MYETERTQIESAIAKREKELKELMALIDFETQNQDDWLNEEVDIEEVISRQQKQCEELQRIIEFAKGELDHINGLIIELDFTDRKLDKIMPYRPNGPEAKALQREYDETESKIEFAFSMLDQLI